MSAARTTIAVTLACAVGFTIAHAATDGLEAFTLESARRLQALRSPVAIPDMTLEYADAQRARLTESAAPVVLVDFIYTRCPTVCSALGSVYARLQERLAKEIAAGQLRLVSITFDPGHDGPVELNAYRARYSTNATGWFVGRTISGEDLQKLLDAFGVVVIPDGLGGFVHNAAIHVVGPDRRLAAIVDYQDVDGVVRLARQFVGTHP